LTLYIGSGFKGHAWGLLELALPSVSLWKEND
jgi:hypothetical protein